MRSKKFAADPITFRSSEADLLELRKVSNSLHLDQAEICRRALRIGLAELRHAKLPGGIDLGVEPPKNLRA
jgi:hypothetical protein